MYMYICICIYVYVYMYYVCIKIIYYDKYNQSYYIITLII